MTLKKGFLKPQHHLSLSKLQMLIGLILGLCFALLLYGLATFFFEYCRRVSSLQSHAIFQFSSEERSFYAWFFASIALILGQNITFWFWAKRCKPELTDSNTISLRLKNIANDQKNLSTYIFAWLARLGTLYFIFYGAYGVYPMYDLLNVYENYNYLLLGIPLVLWLGTWTTISRVFRTKAIRWMGISSLVILGSSFLLSQVDIMNHKAWDDQQKQSNLLYQYEVLLPQSDVSQKFEKRSRLVEFILGYTKAETSKEVTIIYNNAIIGLDEVASSIVQNHSLLDEREIPYITIKIASDKRVPIRFINKLKYQIQRANALKIVFATRLDEIPFEDKSLPITLYGIFQNLRPSDSLDYIKGAPPPPPPPPPYKPCMECFSNKNFVRIASDGSILLNGKETEVHALSEALQKRIKADPVYVIHYSYDSSITLNQYLEVYLAITGSIHALRDEMSIAQYGKPFDDLLIYRDDDKIAKIKKLLPMRLIEPQSP